MIKKEEEGKQCRFKKHCSPLSARMLLQKPGENRGEEKNGNLSLCSLPPPFGSTPPPS